MIKTMTYWPACLAVVLPLAGLAGCSSMFIEKRPMAWEIPVVEPAAVANCESKGGTLVSVPAYVWMIKRDDEAIEENLLQLARNAAMDAGGDTLVKGDSPESGRRNYAIYKCRP
jgi:hypothetical protein